MSDRTSREKSFHEELAKSAFSSRRLVHRLAASFYDPMLLWADVWSKVGDLQGRVALDLGCGSGWLSQELARRGAVVCGLDLSRGLLTLALKSIERSVKQKVSFIEGDAHWLPFGDATFDLVVGSGILHHLYVETAYAEVARVLKPQSYAFFVEPLDKHPALRLFRRLTPHARSPDEKPLSFDMITLANRFFESVSHKEFFLFSVIAAPMNIVYPRAGRMLTRLLAKFDEKLFEHIPGVARYAWIVRIECRKG